MNMKRNTIVWSWFNKYLASLLRKWYRGHSGFYLCLLCLLTACRLPVCLLACLAHTHSWTKKIPCSVRVASPFNSFSFFPSSFRKLWFWENMCRRQNKALTYSLLLHVYMSVLCMWVCVCVRVCFPLYYFVGLPFVRSFVWSVVVARSPVSFSISILS